MKRAALGPYESSNTEELQYTLGTQSSQSVFFQRELEIWWCDSVPNSVGMSHVVFQTALKG